MGGIIICVFVAVVICCIRKRAVGATPGAAAPAGEVELPLRDPVDRHEPAEQMCTNHFEPAPDPCGPQAEKVKIVYEVLCLHKCSFDLF